MTALFFYCLTGATLALALIIYLLNVAERQDDEEEHSNR